MESKTRVKARVKATGASGKSLRHGENVEHHGPQHHSDVTLAWSRRRVYTVQPGNLDKGTDGVINDPTSSVRPHGEYFQRQGLPRSVYKQRKALEMVSKDTLVMVVDTNSGQTTQVPELLRKTGENVQCLTHYRQSRR